MLNTWYVQVTAVLVAFLYDTEVCRQGPQTIIHPAWCFRTFPSRIT